MYLRELKLTGFRTYTELVFKPGEGLNILVGDNAQGKSNLLEAIHLIAISRSLRARRESEMINSSCELAVVSADVARNNNTDALIEVSVLPTEKKSVRINGVKRPRLIELLGQFNAVFFGSLDLGIVSDEPSIRRRFLNLEISQVSPKYCFDFASHKKVLEQRNRLLKELRERPYQNSGLDAWNEQLVRFGAPLFEKRKSFLERIAPMADEIHRELTDGRESLSVIYQPNISLPCDGGVESIAQVFREELVNAANDELRRGVTLVGPQRDDIQFLINGADARSFGSQGQQRTVVLSLKLAEYRLMEEYIGESPVVLLDDVMSDLDDKRRLALLEWMRNRCQTFITCTNLRSFPADILADADIFHVEMGSLRSYIPVT